MTHSCRICIKIFCPKRGEIEDCEECVSEVYAHLLELDRKLEEENDRIL